MAQYQGHPPPPHQMYARPDWPHSYGQQHHGLPGPYASPAATTVGSASPAATAGPRPGQVCFFDDFPGGRIFRLLCIFHCRLGLALGLTQSPLEVGTRKVAAFFLPQGSSENSACHWFG